MNPYVNEERARQRISDIQRDMEDSRMLADSILAGTRRLPKLLSEAVMRIAQFAMRPAAGHELGTAGRDDARGSDAF